METIIATMAGDKLPSRCGDATTSPEVFFEGKAM